MRRPTKVSAKHIPAEYNTTIVKDCVVFPMLHNKILHMMSLNHAAFWHARILMVIMYVKLL